MHYVNRYDTETIEGRNKAYADAKEWLGDGRLALVEQAIRSGTIDTMEQLKLVLSFAGLQGFPVRVIGEKNGLYD